MASQSSAAIAPTGNNPFLRAVAALSTLAGWCSVSGLSVSRASSGGGDDNRDALRRSHGIRSTRCRAGDARVPRQGRYSF